MEKVKIGVVGIGYMGLNHCKMLLRVKNIEFIGIFDVNQTICKTIAIELSVKPFATFEELLEQVDAIIISTPTQTHYSLMEKAILADKNIFVEKPFVASMSEAVKIKKLAQKHPKLIIQVGHIERFNPAIAQLKKLVLPEKMISIEARRLCIPKRQIDIDVILDLMIHDIDILLQLVLSPISNIFAVGITTEGQLNIVSALIQFQNGIISTLVANRHSRKNTRTLSITELDRYITTDYITKEIHIYQKPIMDPLYKKETTIDKVQINYGDALLLELEHFIQCIQLQQSPSIGIDESMKSLEIIEIIKRQIKKNG